MQRDGSLIFDETKNAARKDAIVRKLLKHPVSVIVLGEGHDLADNADRVSGGTCEVISVTIKAVREAR